jgi:chromosome segregation ATPase
LKNLRESSNKDREQASMALEDEKAKCQETLSEAEAKYAKLEGENASLKQQLEEALKKADNSETSNAEIQRLQAQIATSDEDCGKVRAELAELQAKLASLEQEHRTALALKDGEIGTQKSRADALQSELNQRPTKNNINTRNKQITAQQLQIEELTKKIEELEAQQKVKSKDVDKLIAGLLTDLESAEKSSESEKATSTSLQLELTRLRLELEGVKKEKLAAEAEVTRLEGLLQTAESGKDAIQTQLTEALEKVRTLEAKITGLQASITDLEAKLAAAKAATVAIKTESNTKVNRATLNATQKNLATSNAEVERLKARETALLKEIESLKEQLTVSGSEKDALKSSLEAKEAELATIKEQLENALKDVARLTAELANAKKAKSNSNAKNIATSKTVADIQAQLDALRQEKTTNDETHRAELEALRKQLGDAQTTIGEKEEIIKRQLLQIKTLEEKVANMPDTAGIESFKAESKRRLQNLLTMLLVDESVQTEAQEYVFGSGELSEQNIKTITKSISSGTCEYFRYLNDLISIQLEFIRTVSDILEINNKAEIEEDIFASVLPNYEKPNPNELLKEITMLFQQFFLNTELTNLSNGSYSNLISILKSMGDKSFIARLGPVKKQRAIKELQRYSLLSKFKVVLSENSNIQLIQSSIEEDKPGIPLVLLSIKMIQLISKVLHDKQKIVDTCGIHITPISVAQGPKKVK